MPPERSHLPFAFMNRSVNPLIKVVLRTPLLHRVLSGRLAVITVQGRHTGRHFTIPVVYEQQAETVRIHVSWPERKRWWRNLRREGRVMILLRRGLRSGTARAEGDFARGINVIIQLDPAG